MFDEYSEARHQMVRRQLAGRNIVNQRVLDVMAQIPRHKFVPAEIQSDAYNDSPLPIGNNQTISQPYIVALMTQLADPQPGHKALDIGTGSGYQAAVLARLVNRVCNRWGSRISLVAMAMDIMAGSRNVPLMSSLSQRRRITFLSHSLSNSLRVAGW